MEHQEKKQWGGARVGSGRKLFDFSDKIRRQLLRALKKVDKEEGSNWLERLADCTRSESTPALKTMSFNAILAILVTRRSERLVENVEKKVVELPSVKQRPKEFAEDQPMVVGPRKEMTN